MLTKFKGCFVKDKNTIKQNKNCKISKYKLIMLQITPNLHLKNVKGGTELLLKWHLGIVTQTV